MPGSSDSILGFGGQTAHFIEANEAKEEQRRGIDDASTAATAKAGSNTIENDDMFKNMHCTKSCFLFILNYSIYVYIGGAAIISG